MDTTIRISVAMATYNGEKYIREQLDSILENLSEQDEVVISDDGSTDNTLEIITKYQNSDARIRLINGPKQGIIANFEQVIKETKGQYIFLSDQDDVWHNDKVSTIMDIFHEENPTLILHDAKVVNETLDQVIMPSFFAYRNTKSGVVNNIIKNRYMGCCMAFQRQLIEKCIPIPRDIQMHDQWIGLMNDVNYKDTYLCGKQLIEYRRHEGTGSDFDHNSIGVMIHNRMILIRYLRKQG